MALSRTAYITSQINDAYGELRTLARRANGLRGKFRTVPAKDLARMTELRDNIARLRRGDVETPADHLETPAPETTETAPQTA